MQFLPTILLCPASDAHPLTPAHAHPSLLPLALCPTPPTSQTQQNLTVHYFNQLTVAVAGGFVLVGKCGRRPSYHRAPGKRQRNHNPHTLMWNCPWDTCREGETCSPVRRQTWGFTGSGRQPGLRSEGQVERSKVFQAEGGAMQRPWGQEGAWQVGCINRNKHAGIQMVRGVWGRG